MSCVYGAVGVLGGTDAVRTSSVDGWKQFGGQGVVEVVPVSSGSWQFGPVRALIKHHDGQCERHEPHGSQPW